MKQTRDLHAFVEQKGWEFLQEESEEEEAGEEERESQDSSFQGDDISSEESAESDESEYSEDSDEEEGSDASEGVDWVELGEALSKTNSRSVPCLRASAESVEAQFNLITIKMDMRELKVAGPLSNSQTDGPCQINSRSVKVLESTFHIDERYEIQEIVGCGAYGVVVSARDTRTNQVVAIKKIEKAFEHSTFTKRTLRELKILRLIHHENVMDIKTIQLPLQR